MIIVAAIISVVFILLGVLHIYWAVGGKVGISKVIPVVEGKPAIEPGKIITLLVAFGLLGIAGIAYVLGFMSIEFYSYGNYLVYIGWLLALVFLVRAIGDFKLVGFFKRYKNSEFATYDTKYYSPFCLLVSAAFTFLTASQA